MHGGSGGLDRLGAWARRRSEPRLWVAIAGAGCLLGLTGLVFIAGDERAPQDGGDGSSTTGIILFLLVVAAGYLLMYAFREAPAASAGVTAVVVGLPILMFFLTFDENGGPLVNLEAVLGLSAVVWLLSYAVGPGRGRPLLLAAGLVFTWLFALQAVDETAFLGGFDEGFTVTFDDRYSEDDYYDEDYDDYDDGGDSGPFGGDVLGDGYDPGGEVTSLGFTSLIFGVGYLVGARLLDRRGFAGTATPFVVAGHIALPIGIAMLDEELGTAAVGVLLVVAGGLVAWLGARSGRRVTTIIGAGELAIGLTVVVGDAMEDASPSSVGVALFAVGLVVVAVGQLLHLLTGEPPQSTPGPSTFSGRPRQPQTGSWPGYPQAPGAPGFPPAGPDGTPPGGPQGMPGALPPVPPPPTPSGSAF